MTKRAHEDEVVRPTHGELQVLRMLWTHGAGTARQIQADLEAEGTQRAFNTTQQFIKVMLNKGLLQREGERRPHLYRPAQPQEQMQQQLIADLLYSAFGGRPAAVVAALVANGLSDEDREAIYDVLAE
ncbi:MAG: BlaI/MecI/CopY family transcriptional regulator [Planctomycetota bacterium]